MVSGSDNGPHTKARQSTTGFRQNLQTNKKGQRPTGSGKKEADVQKNWKAAATTGNTDNVVKE